MGKISAPMVHLSTLRCAACAWMGLSLASAQHRELVSTHGWEAKHCDVRLPVATDLREDELFVGESPQANNHCPKLAQGDCGHIKKSSDPTVQTACTLLIGRL